MLGAVVGVLQTTLLPRTIGLLSFFFVLFFLRTVGLSVRNAVIITCYVRNARSRSSLYTCYYCCCVYLLTVVVSKLIGSKHKSNVFNGQNYKIHNNNNCSRSIRNDVRHTLAELFWWRINWFLLPFPLYCKDQWIQKRELSAPVPVPVTQ